MGMSEVVAIRAEDIPSGIDALMRGLGRCPDKGDPPLPVFVRAKGYRTLVEKRKMPAYTEKVTYDRAHPHGLDCAIMELENDLDLHPGQPRILTADEVATMIDYLRPDVTFLTRPEVVLEGIGYCITKGDRAGARDSYSVEWERRNVGEWKHTRTMAPNFGGIASQLEVALGPHEYPEECGIVDIPHTFIPDGFSGGGAYLRVPTPRLIRKSGPPAPGKLQILSFTRLGLRNIHSR